MLYFSDILSAESALSACIFEVLESSLTIMLGHKCDVCTILNVQIHECVVRMNESNVSGFESRLTTWGY